MYYQGEWLFYWRIQDAQSQEADPCLLHRQNVHKAARIQAYEVPKRIMKQMGKVKNKGHCPGPQRLACLNMIQKVFHELRPHRC